jgi:hypothetical protein
MHFTPATIGCSTGMKPKLPHDLSEQRPRQALGKYLNADTGVDHPEHAPIASGVAPIASSTRSSTPPRAPANPADPLRSHGECLHQFGDGFIAHAARSEEGPLPHGRVR